MTIKLVYRGKEHEASVGSTIRDAVRKIGLQPETVLAVHEGKLLTDDTVLRDGMQIKLVAVISGGGR
jgi:sulfur carrier protein ThiS